MAYDMVGGAEGNAETVSRQPQDRKDASLKGLRILLVEDEFLVALEVEEALQDLGCAVLGPFAKLSKAIEAARGAELDGAILDINLNGEMVYPLAEDLISKDIPFVFLTGYTAADLPEKYRHFRRLQKPLDAGLLRGALLDFRRARPAK
jgi:CheY-like chemotaxis protein